VNLDCLSRTAQGLTQPSAAAAAEFSAVRHNLAAELNQQMSARPDLGKLIGPDNLAMMHDNSRSFSRFMDSMFRAYEPEVLVRTARWVFPAHRAHGFDTSDRPANLDTFVEIVRERMSAAGFAQVCPFFDWLIVNVPRFVYLSDTAHAGPLPAEPHHGSEPI
jgi:hypothetical protein